MKTQFWVLIIALLITCAIVIVIGYQHPESAPVLTLVLSAALIFVTAVSVFNAIRIADATREQSKATAQMANFMKEQYLSTFKPFIILVYENKKLSDSLIKNFTINCIHERGGAALKLKLFIKSDIIEFKSFNISSPMFEKTSCRYTFGVETPNIDTSNIPPKFAFTVVAEYEDTSGNKWESTLELFWDAVIKDIKVEDITAANPRN